MVTAHGEHFPSQESWEGRDLGDGVLRYLRGPGGNPQLADGIEYYAKYFVGSINFPLSKLHRVVSGEPEEAGYYDPQWQENVAAIRQKIESGWIPPPLIVVDYLSGRLDIADGNHTSQALEDCGITSHPTIFCLESNRSEQDLLDYQTPSEYQPSIKTMVDAVKNRKQKK
ncbi:hypothetical protein A3A93_02235 [Candidatus Roizmanbacteria bacterium RIFCSPLOWO2_01_FULL_38_12]|uniref:ParB/Sulfiredoxin domain-containing protein n=1 Tax=Candidatus Roizmanbacteria bacterium RIFCSPLOWO2_01_FULL_38_12 TaxID=1802061 RepID=A0A1F7IY37_9BACT|nr:MAG: hypothetical protein A3A93_02235 [Candidatus Roizmanbacteria bacterium RIFCSPLOWO2_01_FULL_38_12]